MTEKFIPKQTGIDSRTELLIKQSNEGACGVDLPEIENFNLQTGQKEREKIGLPQVKEPQVIRHFVRLSQQNYSIDGGFYPLGSCTMKHNPRLNEKIARLDGFANTHPLQDESSVQGSLELMFELQNWLGELTGLKNVSLCPAAGAQGELSGILAIKKAHEVAGNSYKDIVLIPDSAHGTNPSTATMCGYRVVEFGSKDGVVDFEEFKEVVKDHGDKIAAIMLTNPNTCGKFESKIKEIADEIHKVGGYFYCDGANFNAIMGKAKPAELGVDVMHFNLHKTFSTPHGGGGPGSGPIAACDKLADFLPTPHVRKNGENFEFYKPKNSTGKIKGFHGQFGMMCRALTYMMSHGADGFKQISEDAVLSANYILAKLKNHYYVPFSGFCMHECLITDKIQKGKNITTLDIAKALVEYGFHPMTTFFPLVESGVMLIEPTETEGKDTIDNFIKTMIFIAEEVKNNQGKKFQNFPVSTPKRRMDEVKAARQPILTWVEEGE
jgi:glycine dehydrogenase subunit 2